MQVMGMLEIFLLPKNKAVEANATNLSKLKQKEDSNQYKKEQDIKYAKELKEKLTKIVLKIPVKAGENGKIYGGVTAKEISESLEKDFNISIDKKKIKLEETIKVLGVINVEIKLYEGIIGTLKVHVVEK